MEQKTEDIDPSKIMPLANCCVVADSTMQPKLLRRLRMLIVSQQLYHKFIVLNHYGLPRNDILKMIIKHVAPHEIVPVSYHEEGREAKFFAKRCSEVVEKLCKENLLVPNTMDLKSPLKLKIIIGFTNISTMTSISRDINRSLTAALHKRFDSRTHELNLDKFHTEPELTEYTPLFVSRILYHILNMAKTVFSVINILTLRDNEIISLEPLEIFHGVSKLKVLRLDNNLIKDAHSLLPIKLLEIKEVSLDGNPLCATFDDITSYVQCIKTLNPRIEILDSVSILKYISLPVKKNFVCHERGCDLVETFLEKFFTLYDCNNRKILEGLYNKDALFSVTAAYITGQNSSLIAQLNPYKIKSRNLQSLADYSKSDEYLYKGHAAIMKVFMSLPPTEHDPCTFETDLIYFTNMCAVIVVQGVFREPAGALLDTERVLGFTRTFTLQHSYGCYTIVNDLLHVYNALTLQQAKAFTIPRIRSNEALPRPETIKEKRRLLETVKLITTLNAEWSKKCLEECNFDLKQALTLFVDLYKADKIPPEAFVVPNNEIPKVNDSSNKHVKLL